MTNKLLIFGFNSNKDIYNLCNNLENIIYIFKIKLSNNDYNNFSKIIKYDNSNTINYLKEKSIKFIRCFDNINQFIIINLKNENHNFLNIKNKYNLYLTKNNIEYNFLYNNFLDISPFCKILNFYNYQEKLKIIKIDINKLKIKIINFKTNFKIENSPAYQYLIGKKDMYICYITQNIGGVITTDHTEETYKKLINNFEYGKKINGYNSYICVSKNYTIIDGSHRAAILKYKINNNEIKNKYIYVYLK